jgi:CBS domain-containing protein
LHGEAAGPIIPSEGIDVPWKAEPYAETPKAQVFVGGMAMTTVAHILKSKGRDIFTLPPHRTIAEAANTMAERRIGAIIIAAADGSLAGILSERDIVRALAMDGSEALGHVISRHMTAKVETAREGDSVHEIMDMMTNGKFRHVPVVEEGKLVGIISIGDVVKHRLAEMEAEARAMRDYISA